MCTADAVRASGGAFTSAAFTSAAEALRVAGAAMDYLNSPAVAGLDGTACGELLIALGGDAGEADRRARRVAAPFRRRRRPRRRRVRLVVVVADRQGRHVEEGRQGRSPPDAPARRAARCSAAALAAGDITDSLAFTIAGLDPQAPAPDARRDRPDPAGRRSGRGVPGRPGHHRRVRDRDLARAAARPRRPDDASRTATSSSAPRSATPG